MNIHSIKFKIIFNMAICVVIAVILVGGISIYQSREMIETYSKDKLDLLVRSYANKIDGVSGASEETDINQKIAEEKIYKTGYLSLVDEALNFIVHPNFTEQDNLMQIEEGRLQFLLKDIKENSHDTVEYTDKGQKKIITYYTLDNGYVVMGNVLEKEIFEDLNDMIKTGILIIFVILLLSIGAAIWLGNKITKPLMKLTSYLNLTAQLDLVNLADKDTNLLLGRKDEIGIMANAVTEMRRNLKNMAKDIKGDGNVLREYTDSVSSIMEEASLGIESVSEATHDLAEQSVQLATIAQEGVENLHHLTHNISTAVVNSNEINLYIEKITESSKYGMKAINTLHHSVTHTTQSSSRVLEKVTLLEAKSEEVSQIVNTISSIAKQTNLLALNASIEAARAGEQGNGFAVVADEIRKLAENVAINTREIDSTINEILKDILEAKEEVRVSNSAAKETLEAKINTENQFKDIERAIEHIVLKVQTLIDNINNIDENKNTVLISMERVSAISEETSATTEEVSASMGQQSSHIQKVSGSTIELNQITADLNKLISLYKVADEK